MITPSEITRHLKTYLPIFTSDFTATLTVDSASAGASNLITVSSTNHGLTAGQSIVVTGGTVRTAISDVELADGVFRFTTSTDHDQTAPNLALDTDAVTLAGFTDTAWNDELTLLNVTNRRHFDVVAPIGETSLPTLTGSEYLIEPLILGVYTVDTVPDSNTFTLDFSTSPELPINPVDDMTIISGFRISAAADFKRAEAAYSNMSTDDPYLFVIMTDTDISKDRHTLNDGVAGLTRQNLNLLRAQQGFSTVVFISTVDDLAGVDAQDKAYDDLFRSLLSALYGYEPDSGGAIKYLAAPVGHGPAGDYNSAYYAHTYEWELPTAIDYTDGFLQWPDVAFRDILQTFQQFDDTGQDMTATINLDDEPL